MVVLTCPIPDCGFQTDDLEMNGAVSIINIHALVHSNPVHAPLLHVNAPKLVRPKIQQNSTGEDWNAFLRRWEIFRIGSNITNQAAPSQLLECTTEQLGNIVLRAHPQFTSRPIDEALTLLKSIAVVPVALGVLRSDLASMRQDPDEPFRTFAARVQGKAETCEFKTNFDITCSQCDTALSGETYYTDEAIRDVLLNGIADLDIRREALSSDGIQTRSIADTIAFVETRETARDANPSSSVSALSEYRRSIRDNRQNQRDNRSRAPSPSKFDQSKTASCPGCGSTFHLFTKKSRGWNRRPFTRCQSCWKKEHSTQKQDGTTQSSISFINDDESFGQITAINIPSSPPKQRNYRLDHQIFNKGEWKKAKITAHPRVPLKVSLDNQTPGQIDITAVADSGAQSDLWSLDEFLKAGFQKSDLSPVTLSCKAANRSPIRIEGAFRAVLKGHSKSGKMITCRTLIYVSRDVQTMYLSFETMLSLGIVNHQFPSVGQFAPGESSVVNVPSLNVNGPPVEEVCSTENEICDCPRRTPVPTRPKKLPFACIKENNSKMRDWLLQRYSGSTFNTCPHQNLPTMTGPPVEIHLKDDARPVARHKPIPVPIHWQDQVRDDLFRDESLGVIERVPYGEPSQWCHRMVVTRKHDGSPRRTVDLSPLNKHCKRETHNAESPFHLARRIPRNTWKTVTDAWNGFHSVPLRESDRHLTTFITTFGRWRYKRAPQGFLSSGDGYNRRFDAILTDFDRKERIIDDTIFYDDELESHWWRTIEFLETVGNAGIVLNPEKFQFASREVDFAGFRITDERIDPLPKFYNAIKDFPIPKSTTDIRSWFGLVNQVANYAQLRQHMEPFRPFLSPRHPFKWTPDLNEAFEKSKSAIVEAIREGVEIFDLERPTCLRTDWSKKGIGYFLLQKHCSCSEITPECCDNGWRITLAGSRFLKTAEEGYDEPIEGEALAIAYALEQTKYFTLGCKELIIATDHEPLVKIFGDRTLDEIPNNRLFKLKKRSLPWYFKVIWVPGKNNPAANATSRQPSDDELNDSVPWMESMSASAIQSETRNLTSITWEALSRETRNDPTFNTLHEAIAQGFPDEYRTNPSTVQYWRYRDNLQLVDGVIIYNDRVVVPPSLRPTVLDVLHSAHQGASTMSLRARATVFWPGMTEDIEQRRQSCSDCIKNAPSQPRLPSEVSNPPATPFEQTYADYFECVGQHYLVVGDRLSGWTDVFRSPKGSPQAGSEGLICCLRNYFARFGVPEEMSSDGGPEFISNATEDFLLRWGVRHRLSSAYNPQSNGRAEVAVKTTKRLLRSNTSPSGILDNDRFLRAMMHLRNTPDPDCNISPAQIVFGRPIRDAFAFISRLEKFSNGNVNPVWRNAWKQKEEALRQRFHRSAEDRNTHAKSLPSLQIGDRCYIQNQTGPHPKRWDRSGTIVEDHGHSSYTLKVDGTGRVTRRNRQYLRKFTPASTEIVNQRLIVPNRPSIAEGQTVPTQSPVSSVRPTLQPSTTVVDAPNIPVIPFPLSPAEPPQDVQLPTPTPTPPHTPRSHRPRRQKQSPKRYEPETGLWK